MNNSHSNNSNIHFLFIAVALTVLISGVLFGVVGGLQYIIPGWLKDELSFERVRPLHVTMVISWIFAGAMGGIYYYLPQAVKGKLYSPALAIAHLVLFILTGLSIIACYFAGVFGGREYFEFPPAVAIPMLITWLLFVANMLLTLKRYYNSNTHIFTKVYIWMWLTGMFFFLLTFLESYLWLFSFFGNNLIRDITVQWKASGAMVGSWNMLVYGTAFYVMEKMSGDESVASSKLTFFFYFLGLTNLMFNWGHHTYIVPASPWIRDVAYIISMTELLILGNIIWNWRKTVSSATKTFHLMSYRFFTASDVWIFINLVLAIAISVPFINRFTHGTHITVAHAMGTTIGINTFILFASLFYLLRLQNDTTLLKYIKAGFWILNVSLLIFWVSLIASGITKTIELTNGGTFASAMQKMLPYFYSFFIAGIGILAGILLIAIPALVSCIQQIRQNRLVSFQPVT